MNATHSHIYLGGGGAIYVGVAGGSVVDGNISNIIYRQGENPYAYLALYNNLIVGNHSRGTGGMLVADDVLGSYGYATSSMQTVGGSWSPVGVLYGFYNVIGTLNGVFQIDVENVTGADAEAIFDVETQHVAGKYLLNEYRLLKMRNDLMSTDPELFAQLNRENFELALFNNSQVNLYAYRDMTPDENGNVDTNWYTLGFAAGNLNGLGAISLTVASSAQIQNGIILDVDAYGSYRTPFYSVGAAQNTEIFAWTKDAAGETDEYFTITEVMEGLEKKKKKELKKDFKAAVSVVRAPVAGYFADRTDGYETILTTDALADLTTQKLQEQLSLAAPSDAVDSGKIVSGYEWFMACIVPDSYYNALAVGKSLSLRMSFVLDEAVPVTVYACNKDNAGNLAVVFRCDYMSAELSTIRKEPVQIQLVKHTGLKVPKRAIVIDENQQAGVYVRSGNVVAFRKIEQQYSEPADYVICKEVAESGYLRLYDDIIVGGRDLYDGKIIS